MDSAPHIPIVIFKGYPTRETRNPMRKFAAPQAVLVSALLVVGSFAASGCRSAQTPAAGTVAVTPSAAVVLDENDVRAPSPRPVAVSTPTMPVPAVSP